MNEVIVQKIITNPWVVLAIAIVGVISLVSSIIFYFKAKRDKEPMYGVKTKVLIEKVNSALEGLELRYKGVAQDRICVTNLVFWNKGRSTINGADIAKSDPLRIEFPQGVQVLDIQMTQSSSEGCLPETDDAYVPGSVEYRINFDYLDNGDYFVAQIVHTGAVEEKFSVAGKIKGVRSIEEGIMLQSFNVPLSSKLPFASVWRKFEVFFDTRYGGALCYGVLGVAMAWMVHSTKASGWLYVMPGMCFFAGAVMLIGARYRPPVRI
ncbi:hypothetical protein LGN19_21140 [Burkholderia sp. AU30198]|uniref:hypothetical protein n=1 Tax=Burkholderia sp. AU30198 TaxID=2879627 RepID=UPI001CF12AC0|nr:hypothetical protein [Burkholderia sp. AU30198]MCA8296306.1 hypothetical protein [Burkholderia sp. AU30198]